MNTKLCRLVWRRSSSLSNKRSRFYEVPMEARAVFIPMEQVYGIYLDKNYLVTPKRNPVKISSEALALAVAKEWNMQKNELRTNLMRLTGLIFTAIDNPISDLLSQVLEFLDKDTILYRLEENSKLLELEKRNWDPVVQWINWEYEALIDSYSRTRLANQLSDYSFLQLIGLQYAIEALKSVFLTLATVSSRLHVDEAVGLALLEQKYQSDIWGKVEWAHDIEREELISRLSAGVLLVHLGDSELEKETKSEGNKIMKNDAKSI
uniref:ATP synthase mitochondrial F1 complex assembly factor 2 n=1 Tax=Setaria digitata TaxID=48799 RepID=A0A915PTC5_9BILA